jgi:hypothetical protein
MRVSPWWIHNQHWRLPCLLHVAVHAFVRLTCPASHSRNYDRSSAEPNTCNQASPRSNAFRESVHEASMIDAEILKNGGWNPRELASKKQKFTRKERSDVRCRVSDFWDIYGRDSVGYLCGKLTCVETRIARDKAWCNYSGSVVAIRWLFQVHMKTCKINFLSQWTISQAYVS